MVNNLNLYIEKFREKNITYIFWDATTDSGKVEISRYINL